MNRLNMETHRFMINLEIYQNFIDSKYFINPPLILDIKILFREIEMQSVCTIKIANEKDFE